MIILDTKNQKSSEQHEGANTPAAEDLCAVNQADAKRFIETTGDECNENQCECTHCGLPVPSGLIKRGDERQFCCNGCRTAYELITSCDLDEFYRFADKSLSATPTASSTFEEFDSEYFLNNHTTIVSQANSDKQLRKVTLAIDGLHCSACIWLLEKLPRICPAVANSSVNWNSNSISIYYDVQGKLSEIASTLCSLGYFPSQYTPSQTQKKSRLENRKSLFDLGFAGAAAGNNMLVALALYLGQFYGMTSSIEKVLVIYSGLISSVSVFGPGRKILAKAVWAMRTRTPHMDLPVALGISIGLIAGWVNIIAGSTAVFFDSISVLVFVLLLGRYIQQIQQRAAVGKLSLLNRLIPTNCQRREKGQIEKIDVNQIRVGDRLVIERQQTLPVDGELVSHKASIDTSILTGESFPVSLLDGEQVYAGTKNVGDPLEFIATSTVNESKVASIFADVEESIRKKTRIVQLADRIGARFVLVVLILALVTFVLWLPDWQFAVNATVAVMIVACPCALALATPVAISVALGSALSRKILVKDGDAFELLANCQNIWFDKTGTLTEGSLTINEWIGDEAIKLDVARVEASVKHPIAAAITNWVLDDLQIPTGQFEPLAADHVEQYSNGVSATINSKKLSVGARKFIESRMIPISSVIEENEKRLLNSGCSTVFVALENEVVAVLAIGDKLRNAAKVATKDLHENYQVGILSGDRSEIVNRTADQLGIEKSNCFSEITPSQKASIIENHPQSLMIGDGVNDCSALAAADIGIAINDNVDLNSRVASIVLPSDQLDQIPVLLEGGRRVMQLIRRNIVISLGYNVITVSLAMSGYIHPVIAAIFMPVSSITILLASLCSNPFQSKRRIE